MVGCAVHPDGLLAAGHTSPSALRIVAVVPARYSSTRLPGKPLADIGGKPMVQHVYERAAQAVGVTAVLVATDDARVAAAVTAFGGRAVMTRADHPSGTDRLAEVAAGLDCDIVVNVQGDEPLLPPAMIAEAVAPFADASVLMTTLRRPFADAAEAGDPNVVKVVCDRQGDALYFSRLPIPYGRGAAGHFAEGLTSKHIGLYAYRRAFLLHLATLAPTPLELAESLEQLRVLEHGYRIRVAVTTHDSRGVDTPADLEHVRRLVAGTHS
jgi:3-deoxy-manno-octulosonate cytidylyltransferase (CMP-KDO synthetase)